jgi:uncharacterized C2H2 Zn-finger protein
MDPQLASYLIGYYSRFMSKQEHLAYRHLLATMKASKGLSDATAQKEVERIKPHPGKLISTDPEVLQLARGGMEAFVDSTATRILAEHANEVFLNHCPRCGRLAKTPKARHVVSAFMIGTKTPQGVDLFDRVRRSSTCFI